MLGIVRPAPPPSPVVFVGGETEVKGVCLQGAGVPRICEILWQEIDGRSPSRAWAKEPVRHGDRH